jgi:cysteine desulfurase
MRPIYLDCNATTPLLPEAREAMDAAPDGNASSLHFAGRKARQALGDAREKIAALLGARPDELTFTSGATEANNQVILGQPAGPLVGSEIEHTCVAEPLRFLGRAAECPVDWWPVTPRGIVVPQPLRPHTRLVCVMLANHETGALQPVRDIAQSLPPGCLLHCDAAQAVGKIPVNFRELGAGTLVASAHKFGGPKGIGVLLARRGQAPVVPRLIGGTQQEARRPGTEPVPLVVGMAAALEVMVRDMAANHAMLEALRARFWTRLQEVAAPVVLNGPEIGAPDVVPTTLNISFPGCRWDLLFMALDLAGVACSVGSACSSGSPLPSPVLEAMGVPDDVLRSAIRFSFSASLDLADIDEAADRVGSAAKTVRESAS